MTDNIDASTDNIDDSNDELLDQASSITDKSFLEEPLARFESRFSAVGKFRRNTSILVFATLPSIRIAGSAE